MITEIVVVALLVSQAFTSPSGVGYPAETSPRDRMLFRKDLRNSIDEVYGSYYQLDNRKDNELQDPNFPQPYYNGVLQENPPEPLVTPDETRRVERTAYLHIQTKQKDKRYASYLTLCHFKICNMGRKRTTRFFHVISSLDNGT